VKCQWLTGLSAGDGLQIFRRLNQCNSAVDGLAMNRLALARNGCGLQVYGWVTAKTFTYKLHRKLKPTANSSA